ncbi:hypothetical protein, partial [Mycolicibacterium sp.]|uniref:hypothetical protein n=1 Tax=Mycolicibacterium sp. TaxID=2320850 RepID=UPI0037C70570
RVNHARSEVHHSPGRYHDSSNHSDTSVDPACHPRTAVRPGCGGNSNIPGSGRPASHVSAAGRRTQIPQA